MIVTYTIEHRMHFKYPAPARDSVMTLYVCPVRDRTQLLREFSVLTDPDGPLFDFIDPFGNTGHFLDRLHDHEHFAVTARSVVEVGPLPPTPERLDPGASEELQRALETVELWPMVHPSRFVGGTPALDKFVETHDIVPGDDLLVSTRELCTRLHQVFEYAPGETRVDSPIDRILETGRGVCQDYAHVMAAILRGWGIPCRYVSGYLGPPAGGVAPCESHAWVECWFPGIGWIGFDPTNDTEGDERHIRVAVGRDYADVPPTRGVFRGAAGSILETEVLIERNADATSPAAGPPHGKPDPTLSST